MVLDSFNGSGVTSIEAVKLGRKAIGVDLNPLAIKLCRVCLTSVDISKLEKIFNGIEIELKDRINSLYKMNDELITHVVWSRDKAELVKYKDREGKNKERKGTEKDVVLRDKPSIKAKWYPTNKLIENSRLDVKKEERVCDLFTNRALTALSLILDKIDSIDEDRYRNVYEIIFTGMLMQCSKMVFVKHNKKTGKIELGSGGIIGYWQPKEYFELNAWNCFERRYKKVLNAEKEINELFGTKQDNFKIINGSATSLPIEDNSIDYVFTDPPHTDRILYMEQSYMWNSWLRLDSDFKDEIIVSGSKERKDKTKENYIELLDKSFSEIKRVLKDGKYFSFAFNCLDDEIWLSVVNLFNKYGFTYVEIEAMDYKRASIVQRIRDNGLKSDFIITVRNENRVRSKIEYNDNTEELSKYIQSIYVDGMKFYEVMNMVFRRYLSQGKLFKVSKISDIFNKMHKSH